MFRDRAEAGGLLAEMVASRRLHVPRTLGAAPLVLGLPRGGVPVAALVAAALDAPLDVLVVRKIGVPWQPELALGAVGERGAVELNDGVVASTGLRPDEVDGLVRKAAQEVADVVAELRPQSGPVDPRGRMVIVVDDGVATGATARAAASVLRRAGAGQIILATPVAAPGPLASLRSCFDDVVCLQTPWRFGSVGAHYEKFEQVSNAQVRRLLDRSTA